MEGDDGNEISSGGSDEVEEREVDRSGAFGWSVGRTTKVQSWVVTPLPNAWVGARTENWDLPCHT